MALVMMAFAVGSRSEPSMPKPFLMSRRTILLAGCFLVLLTTSCVLYSIWLHMSASDPRLGRIVLFDRLNAVAGGLLGCAAVCSALADKARVRERRALERVQALKSITDALAADGDLPDLTSGKTGIEKLKDALVEGNALDP